MLVEGPEDTPAALTIASPAPFSAISVAYRLTREEGGPAAARGGRGRIEGGGVETEATAVP